MAAANKMLSIKSDAQWDKRAKRIMKKITFILAAIFAATVANAQIELVQTYNIMNESGYTQICTNGDFDKYNMNLPCPFLIKRSWTDNLQTLQFINPSDFSVYKSKSFNFSTEEFSHIVGIAYDVFAEDKLAFIIEIGETSGTIGTHYKIIDEDENVLLNFSSRGNSFWKVVKLGSQWYLYTLAYVSSTEGATQIYTLPGDGSLPDKASSVSNLSSPKHSARKVLRDGQVLVETETNTYTLQGIEVK